MKKKIFVSSVFIAILLLNAILTFGCTELTFSDTSNPTYYSELRVVGKDIVNEQNEKVRLRGTNAGSYFIHENWMSPVSTCCYNHTIEILSNRFGESGMRTLIHAYEDSWWTEVDFDNVKKLGFNAIRLPISYVNLTNLDGTYYEKGFQKIDWFLSKCAEKELYVILDLHGAYGSQNGYDHSGNVHSAELFSSEENMNATVELWKVLATRYKDNFTIAGFDLLNEPTSGYQTGNTEKKHWDFYDRLYKEIRKIDEDRVIIMMGTWDVKNLPAPSKYGWQNVIYQFHNYHWSDTKSVSKQTRYAKSKLRGYRKLDVPVFIGEFSAFSEIESWQNTLDAYESVGCHWTTWSYKVSTTFRDDNNMWGLYCAQIEQVDVNTDSYEKILSVWSNLNTSETFVENKKATEFFANYVKTVEEKNALNRLTNQ